MEERLEEPVTLAEIAAVAGLSPHHFHRVFRAVVGENPKAHLRRLRLERAVYRLKDSTDTVLHIALESGFATPETFTRASVQRFDHPDGAAPMEQAQLAPSDAAVAFNTAFGWDRPRIGVQLTDGVGEIELASVFDTYGQSLAVGTVAVGDGPVRSRHGLTFLPRTERGAGLDRLVVPGTTEHDPVPGMEPEHPHHQPGFAFDAVLQDLARTTDVATAEWTAKTLEYPIDDLALDGPAWPWTETFRPLALGVLVALGAFALVRARRRRGRAGRPG